MKASGSIFTLNLRHPRVLLWSFRRRNGGFFTGAPRHRSRGAKCLIWTRLPAGPRSSAGAVQQRRSYCRGRMERGWSPVVRRRRTHGSMWTATATGVALLCHRCVHTPHAWHGMAWHGASHPTLHDAARRLARRQHETHRPTSRHVRAHAHSRAHPPRRPAAHRQHEPARRARRPAPACRPAALRGGRGEGRGRGRVQGCGGLN